VVQYWHSQEVKLRTFEITLVTGEGGWYGTIQVEGNDDSRRSIRSISREAIDPPVLEIIRRLHEELTIRDDPAEKSIDLMCTSGFSNSFAAITAVDQDDGPRPRGGRECRKEYRNAAHIRPGTREFARAT
jgi:putative N-acetylmannosamine-6-phosphate epimerase